MSSDAITVEKKATKQGNVIETEIKIMKEEWWNATIAIKKVILLEIVEVQIEIQIYQHVLIVNDLDTQSMNVGRSNGMTNSEEMWNQRQNLNQYENETNETNESNERQNQYLNDQSHL